EPQDDPREMRIVWCRPAELIIGYPRAKRAVGEVLQLPTPAIIPYEDIELAVRAELDHAAIVVAAEGLSRVRLEGAQPDQVAVERERGAIPHKAVHAVAEQGHLGQVGCICADAALGPVQIDAGVTRKVRVPGD